MVTTASATTEGRLAEGVRGSIPYPELSLTCTSGFGQVPSFSGCEVTFATTQTKKRAIGEFNGWKITGKTLIFLVEAKVDIRLGIKMRPDLDIHVEVPEDYVPPGPYFSVTDP